MDDRFDPAFQVKLDAFTVPALPAGFADRLVEAAMEDGDAATQPQPQALPPLRRATKRRWLRGGAAGLGVIAVGMLSISAAAMGYFGEPIRHAVQHAPVVGKVIERVLPRAFHHPVHVAHIVPAHLARRIAPEVQLSPSIPQMIDAAPPITMTPLERRERRRVIMADPINPRAWMMAHPRAAERIRERRAERFAPMQNERRMERRQMRLDQGFPAGATPRLRALRRAERIDAWPGQGPSFTDRPHFADRPNFAERRPFAQRRPYAQRRPFAERRRMMRQRMGRPGRFRRF